MKWFSRIPAWIWSAMLLAALLHPYAYMLVAELWYLVMFRSTAQRAAEYYCASERRYSSITLLALVVGSLYFLSEHIYGSWCLPLSAYVYTMGKTILLFALLLILVWQIVILLNSYTYTLDNKEFKDSKAKYLLLFIIAPVGALVLGRKE